MKHIKRISIIFFSVLILVACVPIQAFAVDPVSAATMANAFAQAITAYGASQGVSMTFDVANTDGIGEGLHELWEEFRTQTQDQSVDTFDSYAVTLFYNLFKKSSGGSNNNNNNNDKVAVAISAATVAVLDKFWNWLLSGPAEMTKVDNAYAWNRDSSGNVVPVQVVNDLYAVINGYMLYPLPISRELNDGSVQTLYTSLNDTYGLIVNVPVGSNIVPYCLVISLSNEQFQYWLDSGSRSYSMLAGGWYYVPYQAGVGGSFPGLNQTYNGTSTSPSYYFGSYDPTNISTGSNALDIRPYVGDIVPQNVYIPDNTDVNYEPVAVEIPLDINWDDSLFGDGTDTLTDAQAEAITNTLSDTIVQSDTKTLELADTANPPVSSGVDTFHSVLPFGDLPSFQFNFSGIWHYVREWVSSLGAWLTTMFTIWNGLPYAIVVPVYASAVIVIVLGVYKRFFM